MIRAIRKWWIGRKIDLAIHNQGWYARHADAAMDEVNKAVEQEALLRQKLVEVDFPINFSRRERNGTRGLA